MKRETVNRWAIYLTGMLILTLGLYLNARCGLGTSALLAVAYVGTQVWDISFGDASLVVYVLYVLGQFLVRGKKYRQWTDLLQIPVGLLVSQLFDLLAVLLPYEASEHGIWSKLSVLLCAVVCVGVGAALSVNMRLVPTPGDGIVQALADVTGKEQGIMKNIFDISSVAVASVMSLVLLGRLEGVGIGTLAAMLLVGRVISAMNGLFQEKMLRAAGLEHTMRREAV